MPESIPPDSSMPRRRYTRLNVNMVVKIVGSKVTTQVIRQVNDKIKNISMGGAYVECESPYDVNTVVDLRICLPNSPKEIAAKGIVKWKNTAALPHGMGIEFLSFHMTDQDNLRNFIKKRMEPDLANFPELLEWLGEPDPILSKAALQALKKVTNGVDYGRDIARWQAWYDLKVKKDKPGNPA